MVGFAAHFNVILSEESTYQLKRKSDKIDKIMIVYLYVCVRRAVFCCGVGRRLTLVLASIVCYRCWLLKRYGCHCRYSFRVDFVLGRFAYDSSLSHQI